MKHENLVLSNELIKQPRSRGFTPHAFSSAEKSSGNEVVDEGRITTVKDLKS